MTDCINCQNKGMHIADGLYLCPKCEKEERFHLVRSIETGKMYWKNINWAVVDEEIVA